MLHSVRMTDVRVGRSCRLLDREVLVELGYRLNVTDGTPRTTNHEPSLDRQFQCRLQVNLELFINYDYIYLTDN